MYYQQGDVIIEKVEEVNEAGAVLRDDNVLYYGETSGHAHRMVGEVRVLEQRDLTTKEDVLYLVAPEGGEVVHEEHKPIRLPPGNYRVRKVREFDHFAQIIRPVFD